MLTFARDVRQVLEELPLADSKGVTFTVRNGVVTFSGSIESALQRQQDLIAVALRQTWNGDGVVDVVNKLGEAMQSQTA